MSSSLLAFFTHLVLLRYLLMRTFPASVPCFSFFCERVHRLGELRACLAEGPADVAPGRDRDLGVRLQCGEHLDPEIDHEAVRYRRGNEPGGDHLEKISVLEDLVRGHYLNRGLALGGEPLVERPQVFGVAAGSSDVNLLPREVVDARDDGSVGTGHQDLGDSRGDGIGEVDLLRAPRGDGQGCRGDVSWPARRRGMSSSRPTGMTSTWTLTWPVPSFSFK